MNHPIKVGILALQGGYAAHATILKQRNVQPLLVRKAKELANTEGLILPGGESSVFIKLLQENGLWDNLIHYRKPILGTCAGAILLAENVSSPSQISLNRIGISIERNAYGGQLASHIKTGTCLINQCKIEMVLIRAPKIIEINRQRTVKILATLDEKPMAVQEGNCIAATFHPELSLNNTLHDYFLQCVEKNKIINEH